MKHFLKPLPVINSLKKGISLKGRNYINPTDLSANEMKSLLLTAIGLKTSENNFQLWQASHGKNVTFLLNEPCIRLQTCLHDTTNLLKMSLNVLVNSKWETSENSKDIGRLLSSTADIIFCRAHRHIKVENFAKGSKVPVVNVSSCRFILLQILSDLLTLQQHFGYLNGLIIAWIGTACPVLNTYLTIAPPLGIKIKFLCQCGGPVSPSNLHQVQSQGPEYSAKIQECGKLLEAIEGANVIATSQHFETSLKLKLADLEKYADKNWVFLHTLPRSLVEVEEEIFDNKRNLLWTSFVNSKWICASIISKFLDFEKKETEEGNSNYF